MSKKEQFALIFERLQLNKLFFGFSKILYGKHIRVVNYHNTSDNDMDNFENHLRFYANEYSPVTIHDLRQFFEKKKWHKEKPGLIISFDDGWRDNFKNAAPLLEKYGYTGWFFVTVGMVDADSKTQMDFVGKTEGRYKMAFDDGRYLMSWEELIKLNKRHVVGCHTMTHHRMNLNDSPETLKYEIADSKLLMEQKMNCKISCFCWAGGELHTYSKKAAQMIKSAGYEFSFMTNTYPLTAKQNPLQIQRTNIETRNSIPLVRFQLSLLMDLVYYSKRRKVNKLTKV